MPKVPVAKALKICAASVLTVIVAVVAGWLIDDVWLGDDLPRGVSVADIDVSRLSRPEALSRLAQADPGERRVELAWAGQTAQADLEQLGVAVSYEDALDSAADRGSLWLRPYRWLASLVSESSLEPSYSLDSAVLASFLEAGEGVDFGLDFGHPVIELVDQEFTEVDARSLPVVDAVALGDALLAEAARRSPDIAEIEVPVAGTATVDRGAAELIETASAITAYGIRVRLANDYRTHRIGEAEVRSWIVFDFSGDEPRVRTDPERVMASLHKRFDDFAFEGESVGFFVSAITDRVYLTGGTETMACCDPAAADEIENALHEGTDVVVVRPTEDQAAVGSLAWAESLGITELVGEFTTYFEPGQSRVTNIARISDLTRGAVIEPGETFSVNDYVGRRTRANGFIAAGMISDGVFVDSVGGGISQYATTLFNAAFFAGLDFGEYQSHSIYLSRYPYGREATVSFPRPDLQIVNSTPYGILIWPTTTDDSITVKLFSTRWATGEQTGQTSVGVGRSCTKVTTERTRTFAEDQRTVIDYVTALYRPTGIRCDGSSSVPTSSTAPPTTTTTPAPGDTASDAVPTTAVPTTSAPTTTSSAAPVTTTTSSAAPVTTTTSQAPATTTIAGGQ